MTDSHTDPRAAPTSLSSILTAVWRFKYLIVGVTVLAGLLGYGLSLLIAPTYSAEARLFLKDPRFATVAGQDSLSRIDPVSYVSQQARRMQSRAVLSRAAELLGDGTGIGVLEEAVDPRPQPEFFIIEVRASALAADRAAQLANAVAQAYMDVTRAQSLTDAETAAAELESESAELAAQISELQAQLSAAPDDPVLSARLQSLIDQQLQLDSIRRQLSVNAAAFGSGVDILEQAESPDAASSPRPKRNAALVGALAFVLACAAADWLSTRSRRVVSRDDPASVLGAPLLAEVPSLRVPAEWNATELQSLEPGVRESFEFALAATDYALQEVHGSSVAVTSATAGEGKTLICVLLAITAAQGQRQVALVDADVRARGLTRRLGRESAQGLTDLAIPGREIADSLEDLGDLGVPQLYLVPAGRHHVSPTQLFRSPGFTEGFRSLWQRFDLVIADTPPLLAVADAGLIAPQVDGIVLVVNRGTPISQLVRLRQRLEFATTPILGYIFNRSAARELTHPYAYGADRDLESRRRGRRKSAPATTPPEETAGSAGSTWERPTPSQAQTP